MSSTQSFYGWKLVAVFFAVYFMNTIPYYSGSVIAPFMAPDIGMERSQLGFAFTLWLLTFGFCSPVAGRLVQSIGVRKLVSIGTIILVVATLLMAFVASKPWHFIALFGIGCGMGFSFGGLLPIQSGVMYWFDERKALALGIVVASTGVAILVAAPLITWIIENNANNWRLGWYFAAAACLIGAVIAALGIRNKPEDLGQHIDGKPPIESNNQTQTSTQSTQQITTAEMFRTSTFWLIVFGSVGYVIVQMTCIAHGVIHLKDIGHDADIAASSLGLTIAASIIGRLGGGALADRYSAKLILVISIILCALAVVLINLPASNWHIYAYAAACGIGFGAAMVAQPAMVATYFGNHNFAQVYSVAVPIVTLIGAAAPTLAGYVYDQQGSYSLAFNATAVLALVCAALIAICRPPKLSSAAT